MTGSEAFAEEAGIREGETVAFIIDGVRFDRLFKIDTNLSGNVALNPTYDKGLSAALISSYRFNRIDSAVSKKEEVGS